MKENKYDDIKEKHKKLSQYFIYDSDGDYIFCVYVSHNIVVYIYKLTTMPILV